MAFGTMTRFLGDWNPSEYACYIILYTPFVWNYDPISRGLERVWKVHQYLLR